MDELTRERERARLVEDWNRWAPEYDSFPSTLQLVVEPTEIVDIHQALMIGRHVGFNSITRQINPEKINLKGFEQMFGVGSGRITTYITRPLPVGTSQHGDNHNFLIIARKYDTLRYAEIGCFHDMQLVNQSNCWAKWTCSKCEWGYEIDSGD